MRVFSFFIIWGLRSRFSFSFTYPSSQGRDDDDDETLPPPPLAPATAADDNTPAPISLTLTKTELQSAVNEKKWRKKKSDAGLTLWSAQLEQEKKNSLGDAEGHFGPHSKAST